MSTAISRRFALVSCVQDFEGIAGRSRSTISICAPTDPHREMGTLASASRGVLARRAPSGPHGTPEAVDGEDRPPRAAKIEDKAFEL